MTFTRALATNNYGPAKFIVDGTTVANGTHSTIGAAITSSSSGDTIFIRPGTYTEDLTLKAGVNLTAWDCNSAPTNNSGVSTVIIAGKVTATYTGTVCISGIELRTNADFCITSTGSNLAYLNIFKCNINALNNTAINSSNGNLNLKLTECTGNLATTGISLFTISNAGEPTFINCNFTNTGGSTTASTLSGSSMIANNTQFIRHAITTSSTGALTLYRCTLDMSSLSSTCLTHGGGASFCYDCTFLSSTASAISISASSTLTLSFCTVSSTNTNAITGAGTLVNAGISFTNTSKTINTTTQTARNFDVGSISINGSANSATKSLMTTINIQTFVASGTYTPTSGMVYCIVEAIGCGGGGGGAAVTGVGQFSTGSGGGGGEYARGVFTAAAVGASQTVTIGAAGAANSGASGGAGGNVSLGALITANGGAGGTASAAGAGQATAATLGGTGGSGGSVRTPGQPGFASDSAFAAAVIFSGNGGGSLYGAGGIAPNAPGTGGAGLGNGSGGGGSANLASTAAKSGGVGTAGIIVITEYISS